MIGFAPDIAGYRIYWRLTTRPAWIYASLEGDAEKANLENVTGGDGPFAVCSVSNRHFDHPAVHFRPIDSFLAEPTSP